MAERHNDNTERIRPPHVAEHLANERTHLAYLRTSVSVIGLGIAINRFSLYLTQMRGEPDRAGWILSDAENLGVGLVIFGMLLMLWAIIRFGQTTKQINRGDFRPNTIMIALVTAAVLVLGSFSLVWLFRH